MVIRGDGELALQALGNPVRRQILTLLSRGPLPVGAISKSFDVSRPAISKHLKVLESANLVTHESVGTRNVFRLEQSGFDEARQWLGEFWDQALSRFALVAENTTKSGKESDE